MGPVRIRLETLNASVQRGGQEKNADVKKVDIMLTHHANMSVKCRPPYTLLVCSKIGVYRGIHYFLIFALKH